MVTHKIDSLLLTFERKRAILLDLEGGGFYAEYDSQRAAIKLLHDRLEKQANNTLLEGRMPAMMQISVLVMELQAEQMRTP